MNSLTENQYTRKIARDLLTGYIPQNVMLFFFFISESKGSSNMYRKRANKTNRKKKNLSLFLKKTSVQGCDVQDVMDGFYGTIKAYNVDLMPAVFFVNKKKHEYLHFNSSPANRNSSVVFKRWSLNTALSLQ